MRSGAAHQSDTGDRKIRAETRHRLVRIRQPCRRITPTSQSPPPANRRRRSHL